MLQEQIHINKYALIAKYMGRLTGCGISIRTYNGYRTDWNMLMPVIEKISKHVYETHILTDRDASIEEETAFPRTFGMLNIERKLMFRFNRMSLHTADTLIEAAFEACVEFIEWHNSQLKTEKDEKTV